MLTNEDLQAIQKIVKEEVNDGLSVELKPIKRDIQKLRKDLNIISKAFDRDLMYTVHRVDRIEDHLHLPPMQTN